MNSAAPSENLFETFIPPHSHHAQALPIPPRQPTQPQQLTSSPTALSEPQQQQHQLLTTTAATHFHQYQLTSANILSTPSFPHNSGVKHNSSPQFDTTTTHSESASASGTQILRSGAPYVSSTVANSNSLNHILPQTKSNSGAHHDSDNHLPVGLTSTTTSHHEHNHHFSLLSLPPIFSSHNSNPDNGTALTSLALPLAPVRTSVSPDDNNPKFNLNSGQNLEYFSQNQLESVQTNDSLKRFEDSNDIVQSTGLSFSDLHQINLHNLTHSKSLKNNINETK